VTDELVQLDETNHAEIEALLIGRRIVAAEMGSVPIPGVEDPWRYTSGAEGVLTLDDGTRIYARGHEGGCSCGAGDYELTHLATVDNVITSVRFEDSPSGDDLDGEGWYRIFVFADAAEINVASFEGSDGNGYYGTGYELYVQRAEVNSHG
jgi:hypothetical protein